MVNQGDLKSFEKPRWRSATDFQICEVMGLLVIFRENKMKKSLLVKNQSVTANWWGDISTIVLEYWRPLT